MTAHVLGITGGIGSGKSCVGRLLASYCLAPLIDLDLCCRQLLAMGQPGWQALRSTFGQRFFTNDGTLDRVALRHGLFTDQEVRAQVDGLLHPLARVAMQDQIAALSVPLILVEIPLLYEAGWVQDVSEVLVVYARRGVRCCRVMHRDGVSRRAAARAIASQMSLEEKAGRSDYLIDNSGPWTVTRTAVVALGNELSQCFPS